MRIFKKIKLGAIVLLLITIAPTNAFAAVPTDGTYTFIGAVADAGTGTVTTSDGFFIVDRLDGSGTVAAVAADEYGAYISNSTNAVSTYTSYLEVKVASTGSFYVTDATLGDYESSGLDATNDFTDVYFAGYANGVQICATTPISSIGAYETAYTIDYSACSGKLMDKFRTYYTVSVGDSQADFNLIDFTLSGASTTAVSSNNVPLNTLPSAPTVAEDNINVAFADTINIADDDSDNQSVTLTATNGTLSMTASGTSITTGDGTDDTVIAFNGTLSNVNAALDSLMFTPTTNFSGNATLQMQTSDGNGGSDDDSLTIAVANAPEIASINRLTPSASDTNADSLIFRVTFSESVSGITTDDFSVNGSTATVTNVSAATGTTTDVTISGGDLSSLNATVRLDITDDNSIVNASSVGLGGVGTDDYTGDQTYAVDNTAPTTIINTIDINEDTGSSATDFKTKTASQTITATLSIGLAGGEILYGSIDGGSNWIDITAKATVTAISWDGATLSGSSSIKIKVTDAAGNDGSTATQAYILDTTASTLVSLNPTDNATVVAVDSNLVITLNENVFAGTGNIIIYDSANTEIESIPVGDARVSIIAGIVTINPTATLALNTAHYVKIASGVLLDASGNSYVGITNTTDWSFTTVANTAPVLDNVSSITKDEDFSDFNITLTSSDAEDDAVTYSASSNDESMVTVSVVGDQLVVHSILNAVGTTSINVIVEDSAQSDGQTVPITLNTINDAPIINTSFSDFSLVEDNGTTNYELNVSDIDGDDVNLTVESNNTSILTVSQNWTNYINQATYDYGLLDFNLTTVENANGMVQITIINNDDELNTTRTFDVNVTAVNDAPVLDTVPNKTKTEDFITFTLELNATDVDGDNLTYNANSNDVNILDVNVSGTTLSVTAVADANGILSIDYNVTDGTLNDSKSFDINVTSVDDAPTWDVTIPTQNINEDATSYTLDLNTSDVDGDAITYSVASVGGASIVSIVNKKLVITPAENAWGTVTVDLNATANGQSSIQTLALNISPVNDEPTIDTTFTDKTVDEDSGVIVLPVTIGDIEGSDLNLTITSSDSTVVSVSKNWDALVNQGDLLEFNLTLAPNVNGNVTISIIVNDGELTTTEEFDITINPVNDLPSLENLGDRVSYKNFGTKSIVLEGADVDGDTLTYAYSIQDETIFDSVSLVDNNLTFISKQDASGNSDVNVTLSDGNVTVSKLFNFYVAPIEDGEDLEKVGDIEINEDNETKTVTLAVDNNLTVETKEDTNGTVSHTVTLGENTTSALSELVDSIVKILEDGVETSYTDTLNAIVAKVIATVLGEATHTLEVGGKTTTATCKKAGAETVIEKDADNKTRIVTRIGNVEVTADANGTAHHKVGTTTATSQIQGATTTIFENGNVQTEVRDAATPTVRAVVVTGANGESTTSFISDSNVTRSMFTTPYVSGNNVTIELLNGVLYIQTNATLDVNLIVE